MNFYQPGYQIRFFILGRTDIWESDRRLRGCIQNQVPSSNPTGLGTQFHYEVPGDSMATKRATE